ncbi:hypothetical protein QR680_017553 [Steinernema hermaphroditum]|uniref:BUB1 N-terminal domain-containing protein n=1 Tax=Steinernema hermaphroditum TaxID=289476 RepID=A0AA39LPC4_9BILA|nr:hypothetical protein QR680_017553 [Steinernema hermaphroditum]
MTEAMEVEKREDTGHASNVTLSNGKQQSSSAIIFGDDDVAFEEDILRNPYSLRSWERYIEHKIKANAPARQVRQLYERAIQNFNRSYKLWYQYLRFRRRLVVEKSPNDPAYQYLCDAYERCLVFLHKMPRLWIDYCQLMVKRGLITETRRVFDRALRALPVTQHDRIWPIYIDFVTSHNIPETAIRVYRRYLKLNPSARDNFVEYLKDIDQLDEAAQQLATMVNEEKLVSRNFQLWTELAELIAKNPKKVHSLNVESVIRQGISRYSDQVGALWLLLAEYYIRTPNFEKARDIYEEAIQTVNTVRDFTLIFDAYAKFAESAASQKLEDMSSADDDEMEDVGLELDMLMARYESLMERRPLLLNSVWLRQNPHNVHQWLKRVDLFEGDKKKQVETFHEAVKTVNPKMQTDGRLSAIWIAFAKFYEAEKQLDDARHIFESALKPNYASVGELATVICAFVEMELQHKNVEKARQILRRSTVIPGKSARYFDEKEKVQSRVYKSLKVWSLYADIEESFGNFQSCKEVYEKMIDLRIATPQIVINYASFLEGNNYFEVAFKAYEKGIALFRWPEVFDLWNIYLVKFMNRYGGKKLERARDIFEQCIEACPPKFAKKFYLLYAKLEEEYGLARHAMNIYQRGCTAVEKEEMYSMFNIYIKKAMNMFGVTNTRSIYEKAIEILPEDDCRKMSLRYAEMERNLGEIDRARAVYGHCAEICDPRVHDTFWKTWQDFETKHGNEDTLREMLRIRRTVQAMYNTNVNYMSSQMLAASIGGNGAIPGESVAADSMAQLEAKAQMIKQQESTITGAPKISFVKGETQKKTAEATTENPEEIDIGDEDDDEEEEIETRNLPESIYRGLVRSKED